MAWHLTEFLRDLYSLDEHERSEQCTLQYVQSLYKVGFKVQELKSFECITLWVSRVVKYPNRCLEDLTTFLMSIWWGDSKNMEEIEFSWWLFEGRVRQGKNVLPDRLNWLCYFASNSISHRENSISSIFLESPYQVDMKNVVKSSKHFFGYFNTSETHCAQTWSMYKVSN